jgi:hypothetical protein
VTNPRLRLEILAWILVGNGVVDLLHYHGGVFDDHGDNSPTPTKYPTPPTPTPSDWGGFWGRGLGHMRVGKVGNWGEAIASAKIRNSTVVM